ncbi:MAG: hypothetical protein NZ473_09175, partial [Candidatus Kapabacteria bacterium]|nr:hypothetical protein [Candidatus Kapabacteria bacterium]MDW8225844.1 hypothetical protein [Bacteroidota bacterium]
MIWVIAVIALSGSLSAQLNVAVVLREPLPAALSAWQEDPTIVRIVITSTSPTPAYPNAVLGFELRDILTRRIVARSRNDHPKQPRINISPGPTSLSLTGPEIIAQEAVEIDPSVEARAAATGFLPEGMYEFCVRLLDEQLQPIAATGRLCATATLLAPNPPLLLTPPDTTRLSTPLPLFTWTPIQPVIGPVLYRIRISPIYTGQDRRSAIERNNPVYEQTLTTTIFPYPSTAPGFSLYPDAQAFAWQVQALTP